ncbi:MAG: hypothetical protein U0R65_02760 [Candidatus Nanopelagicales bacterium]
MTTASLATTTYPLRRTIIGVEAALALAGAAGAVQLVAGVATPPDSALPMGLTSWALPGAWLFATVAVPSAAAAALAARRSPHAPTAVLVGSGLLALELVVQIPFVGPSALQAVFGTVAAGLAGIGIHARRTGWR